MKKTSISVVLVFLFVLACLAADLTGTYKGSIAFRGDNLDLTYKLKAEGEKLTGSITTEYGEIPLFDGTVTGNNFSYKIDIGNGAIEAKGVFMGDSIVITSNVGDGEVKNTFKRCPNN